MTDSIKDTPPVKQWEHLSVNALNMMQFLGNFGPTVNVSNKEVKGYTYDEDGDGSKTYYTSTDLLDIARACTEVAQWLEDRALAGTTQESSD